MPDSTATDLPQSHGWQHFLALLALSLTVVTVYLNSLNVEWTHEAREVMWEDTGLNAARLKDLRPLLAPAYGGTSLQWDRALPRFSYWANRVAFGGTEPFGAHATNVGIHWFNCVLLYAAMVVVMRNYWAAFFVAALFGVHPIATDAVNSIAGRPELLGAAAVLGGLVCAIRSRRSRGLGRFGWLLLLGLAQAGGLASHESAWTLPVVLACYFFVIDQGAARWRAFSASFAFVLLPLAGAALLGWRRWTIEIAAPVEGAAALNPLLSLDALHARLTALKVVGKSIALLVWPQTLLPDYSFDTIALVRPASYATEGWKVVATALVLLTVLVLAIRASRKSRPILFFTLFFLVTLIPGSNLLWRGETILLERDLYLPAVGFAGWLVCVVYACARAFVPRLANFDLRRQTWPAFAARATLVVLMVALGLRSFVRNIDWQGDETLWTAAVRNAPENYRPHHRLTAVALIKEPKDLATAIREGELAAAIMRKPDWPESHPQRDLMLRLGTAYRLQAESTQPKGPAPDASSAVTDLYARSAQALEAAAAAQMAFSAKFTGAIPPPRLPALYWNLGLTYMQLSRAEEAAQTFAKLATDAPANREVYLRTALAYAAAEKTAEGTVACVQALILNESREPFEILAQLYKGKSDQSCALRSSTDTVYVDIGCEVLQSYLPAAYRGLMENFLAAGDRRSAERVKDDAVSKFGIAPEFFDQLLTNSAAARP